MTVKPYPEYKDSGVEWIGAIPVNWERVPFFAATRERRQKNVGMKEDNLLSLSYGNVVRKDMSSNEGLLPESFETYQVVEPSEVVFRLTDLQNDKRSLRSAIVTERGIITSAYLAVSPILHVPAYFAYLMRSYDLQKVFYSMGGGLRQSMKFEDMKHLPLVSPPLDEQRQIADYLDAQTAKIDALIRKQERLIETLAERRQAVISHAVTKGLDPNAPMKDSTAGWAGEIPSHWEFGNIRRFAAMRTGHTPSRSRAEYWVDCTIPWFTLADVWQLRQGNRLLGETNSLISEIGLANSAAELLPAGTVVLSRTASVGFTGIMPRAMATSQDFWNWVCGRALEPDYLWYQFYAMRPHFASLVQGSTHKTIYQGDAAALKIVAPPIVEQREIVEYLDRETTQIDALSAKAREMIDVLKERRQALISAAVTGKVDVRGLA